jgi:thiamine-monophosphate kinase
VLPAPEGRLLFASDAVVEGVHFRREFSTLGQAVQKAVTSNVSDIFAMGGVPAAIVVTAGIPKGGGGEEVDEMIAGLKAACRAYGLQLAGGDTVLSTGGFFFDIAITGSLDRDEPVARAGAMPGDALVLFGECGGSLAGLELLEALHGIKGVQPRIPGLKMIYGDRLAPIADHVGGLDLLTKESDIEAMSSEHGLGETLAAALGIIKRHLVPLAHPLDPTFLERHGGEIHAMIDISDGLSRDLVNLCAESGVGAVIDEDTLQAPASVAALFEGGRSTLTNLALSSGEEYVLLAAIGVGEGAAPAGGTVIGGVTEVDRGINLRRTDGSEIPLPEAGYEHTF